MEEGTSQNLVSLSRDHQLPQVVTIEGDELSAPSNQGLNLRGMGRTLRRQAWLIAGVTTVLGIAGAILSTRTPPVYEGSFQLLVEPVTGAAQSADPFSLARSEGGAPDAELLALDYGTQIQILTSLEMLNSIVETVQEEYPEFSFIQLRQGLVVERLIFAPETGPSEETGIIQVLFQGADPDLVQTVLEATADRYLKYSLEERTSRSGQGIKFIEDQLPEVQKRVDTLQGELQRLQQQYNLVDPANQGTQISTQVDTITAQQIEVRTQLQEQQALYNRLQDQLALSPEAAIAASALSEDPNYQALEQALQTLNQQIATESVRFSEDSPVMRSLRAQQRELTELLNQQVEQVVGPQFVATTGDPQVKASQNSVRLALIQQLVDTSNQVEMLKIRDQSINQARNAYLAQLAQFPQVARQYADLSRELEVATQTLNRLLSQRETLKLESAQTEVPWELVSSPGVPKDETGQAVPMEPEGVSPLIKAVVMGLGLGTVLAFLLEILRNQYPAFEDVVDQFKEQVVGKIPTYPGTQAFSGYSEDGMGRGGAIANPKVIAFQEAFNSVYSNLRAAHTGTADRTVLLSAPETGDGTTTVAVNLAETIANAGQRVLLVDANLRSPELHDQFNLPNTKGLSNLLMDSTLNFEQVIQLLPPSQHLWIMPSGQVSASSVRFLGSDTMKHLMEQLKTAFDWVIYDASELADVADSEFLATQVSQVLLVVSLAKTKRSSTKKAVSKLQSLQRDFKVVVNQMR